MKKILSLGIATFAALSFTAGAGASDAAKPVVPAGPVYADFPDAVDQNGAEKAVKARKSAEARDAKERADMDARDARVKADLNAAKAKAQADAAAARGELSAPR
jgi:hypothetical protein